LRLLQDGSIVGVTAENFDGGPKNHVFRVDTERAFSVLHTFELPFEGVYPYSLIVQNDGSLIGATHTGGLQDGGTLFRIVPETGEFSLIRHLPPNNSYTKLGAVWMKEVFSYALESSASNLKPTAKDDIIPAQRIKSDGSPDLVTPPRVKIDALANDSDTDGDTLSIVGVSAPRRGLAAIDTDSGKIIYTANGLEVQNDSFTYTVSDARGGTATASVIIQTNAGGRYEGSRDHAEG
jgi:uncharacterized repeat protein (TIGR03803 family)